MTIREFLTTILQKNREMESRARNNNDYAKALEKRGAIEITELIFMEFNQSHLMDREI